MNTATAIERLELSETIIGRYETMGGPTGPLEKNLRIIRDELVILRGIREEHADLAERVKALERRYGELADRMRTRLH